MSTCPLCHGEGMVEDEDQYAVHRITDTEAVNRLAALLSVLGNVENYEAVEAMAEVVQATGRMA